MVPIHPGCPGRFEILKEMKVHIRGPILAHEEVAPGYFQMAIEAPEVARKAAPGQFVHLLCDEHYSPFLRRPLSILFARDGQIGLLYKVVGEGTGIISHAQVGQSADLVGPLGTPFRDEGHERLLLVAGGIGIVPLVFFSERIERTAERVHFVYGTAGREEIVCRKEVETAGHAHDFSTMDGSDGTQGTVIDVLNKCYPPGELLPEIVYACGPGPMMEALYSWMEERNIPGQFSLENRMGCGVGACLGCVLPRRNGEGYLRVCYDGPVFDAKEVVV